MSRHGPWPLCVASLVLHQQQSAVEIGGSIVLQLAPGLKRVCVKLIEALLSCYRYGLLHTGDSPIDLLGEAEEAEAALCGATVKPNHINT